MTDEMKNLLLTLGGIVIVLLSVLILFGGKSPFMRFLNFFLEPQDGEYGDKGNSSEPVIEMVKLVRKSDERVRTFEMDGSCHYSDEYFELEFVTRKGKDLRIKCSRAAYEKIPFNVEGSLTYKKGTLVKLKLYDDIIYNTTEKKENG